jgi:uncharacterized membrane protein YeaQ/YmgE (transglycosylase-associated protein family)
VLEISSLVAMAIYALVAWGTVFGMLAPGLSPGLVGSVFVAFVGAVILLTALRLMSPRRRSIF